MTKVTGDAVLDLAVSLRTQLSDLSDFDWQIKKLRAVRDWALEQQPVRAGGRARIARPLNIGKDSGWYSCRRSLEVGAVGDVSEVDYNTHYGYWGAMFTPDRQWWWSYTGHWVEQTERFSSFFVSVKYLAALAPGEDEPWVVEA